MYIEYADIISRISEPPTWWTRGVPRYGDFDPNQLDVYAKEVVLLRSRCQSCAATYRVGIHHYTAGHLRSMVDYYGHLPPDDPPNACCDGTYATSYQIEIIEFWDLIADRDLIAGRWQRDATMERPLIDAAVVLGDGVVVPIPLREAIGDTGKTDEWDAAGQNNDHIAKLEILISIGCRRPRQVVEMLMKENLQHKAIRASQAAFSNFRTEELLELYPD